MKKFKINKRVSGVVVGRDIHNPEIEFAGATVNADGSEVVHIKYTDDRGCSVVRPYEEPTTRADYEDYILKHPNHNGIVELEDRPKPNKK